MNQTFSSIFINQASDPSSKNYSLYLKALNAGTAIAEMTKTGDVVLLAKKTGEELFAAFIGAILMGRVPLIIQRPSPKVHQSFFDKRMTDLKSKVTVTLCLCEPQDVDKYLPYFKCETTLSQDDCQPWLIHNSEPKDLAFIQMSSGTTGVSKICEVTHEQVVSHCLAYGKVIGMDKTKCVVSWLPLYHDMGLIAAFLLPLIHDAEFHMIDPFDWLINPKVLLTMISEFKGTHCWMPSFAFNHMASKIPMDMVKSCQLGSIEKIISCSEPTFFDDLLKFRNKFYPLGLRPESVCVCYALAENIFAVSQSEGIKEINWKDTKYTSCGKILPDVKVDIRSNNHPVPKGLDDGTVWINSPFMPRTNKCVDGWYNTGDIGFFRDNELYIIGREKDMFVSYGVNIYPEMIEHSIATEPGVIPGRVVCFGEFSKELGTNRIIVIAETEEVNDNKLRMELSSIIKEEFNVAAIVMLAIPGALIKTSSGKFCRVKNKEKYAKCL